MAYFFEVLGWEDYDGNRHEGTPDNVDESYGMLVHAYNSENEEDQHHFWSFVGGAFEDWDQWYDLIEAQMEMYGMAA